jgi:acetyl-CoA carboxylase / biotin carboxylase 1
MSNFFPSVEAYVSHCGGDHAIEKILVANNGIGAIKAIRSIRRWAFETFGNERMVCLN